MSSFAPNIFDINSADTSTAVTQDTTLSTDNTDNEDAGGSSTNLADVLNSLVKVAPSLLVLSRTPTPALPRVTGNASQPVLKPANNFQTGDITTLFIILIIAVVAIMILKK
jgi:hypothetical protein